MTRVSYPRAPSEFSLLYHTQGTDNTNLVNNSVTSESSCSCTHRVTGNIYKGNEKTFLILGAAITSSEEERNTRSPEFPWSPNRSWQETICPLRPQCQDSRAVPACDALCGGVPPTSPASLSASCLFGRLTL